MFKRKATEALMEWKEKYAPKYAALLEGARRVGNQRLQRILPGKTTNHI